MSSPGMTCADSGQSRDDDLAYVAHFARVPRLAEPGETAGQWIDSAWTGPDAVSESVNRPTGAGLPALPCRSERHAADATGTKRKREGSRCERSR